MDVTSKRKHSSLLAWVNSFDIDKKIEELSQLSNGLVFSQCLRLLGFRPDDSVSQSPLEFVVSKLSNFYSFDMIKYGVLELSKISAGDEEEIAKALVLLLCMAVKHSDNEHFIEAILSLSDDVQFDLKYFIESTLEQIDNGKFSSGGFTLGYDVSIAVNNTPACSGLSTSKYCHSLTSPVLQSWLCSPDNTTPRISSNQLFESVEVKELKHQLRMMEKELKMQRSLVTDYEDEVTLLNEEKNNLIAIVARKDDKICQLCEKCEEMESLEEAESKLLKAEEEIKSLKQLLEVAREDKKCRAELQQSIKDQQEEMVELYKANNLLQVKSLKYQHQAQELELECKSQQAQSARSLKRCDEALQKVDMLEKQNIKLQDDLTKQKESLLMANDQNATLHQQNSTLSAELASLQEQYTSTICVVGSQGQENEQLQNALHKLEEKHASELGTKEEQLKILQEQISLLTTRVEKLLADLEQQAKEFDDKEATMKAKWQDSSLQLSKAEEKVKSCQLTISTLTRERAEERTSTAEQLDNLEATYQLRVDSLEQQIVECKETTEQRVAQLTQQELQLKDNLKQKDEQLEQYKKVVTLSEQKLISMAAEYSEVQKENQQLHNDEVDKLNSEHKLIVLELSQQLDEANNKQKKLVDENEKLREIAVEKEAEYNSLQREFIGQRNDHLKMLQQRDKLSGEREMLLSSLKQNQAIARQQIEVMAEELEQLHSDKLGSTSEYEAYQSVMKQKEISFLNDIKELQQKKELALQKEEQLTQEVKQYEEMVILLQQELSSSITEAEERHEKIVQEHSVYLDKIHNEHKLKVMQFSRQLEMTSKEYETFRTKTNQQFAEESERFGKEMAKKEAEHTNLLNVFNKQEKDYLNVLQQVEKLVKEKDKLLIELKQSQLNGKQQAEQLSHQQDMMSKELEQLHNEKIKITAEYQAFQRVMQQKEDGLLHEIAELKQEQAVAQQQLEDCLDKIALMEDNQNKFIVQIDNLNNTLWRVRNEHMVEMESCKVTIDKELSVNSELKMKNKHLSQELNSVKQELSIVVQDAKSVWEQQVKQLEEKLSEVHEQLSAKELSLQQMSQDLVTNNKEHSKVVGLLEEKKNEVAELESGYQAEKRHTATLLEKIAQLQSRLTSYKQQSMVELEAVHNENERLLKSVDQLCSQQVTTNNQLEQDCKKKFSVLEQNNNEKFEEIARMKVEMTSLQNELQVLQLNHKDLTDCLTVEREKNSLLENETKQLKATVKAFEKENARVHKLMIQQKYSVRPCEDEQAHLERLHSEMDQQSSSHVIPLQAAEEDDDKSSNRIEELRTRNTFHPPHLKSCYPTELQLDCGTPRSSELQLKTAPGYLEMSPPHKRKMSHCQQFESPDNVKRRLSAPPTPTTATQQSAACRRMNLRSYLADENVPPVSRPSDAFEISASLDERSRIKMEERKSKMLQRMSGTRKQKQQSLRSTATATKPLRTRNASKKK